MLVVSGIPSPQHPLLSAARRLSGCPHYAWFLVRDRWQEMRRPGQTLYFPAGTYLVQHLLLPDAAITLEGPAPLPADKKSKRKKQGTARPERAVLQLKPGGSFVLSTPDPPPPPPPPEPTEAGPAAGQNSKFEGMDAQQMMDMLTGKAPPPETKA